MSAPLEIRGAVFAIDGNVDTDTMWRTHAGPLGQFDRLAYLAYIVLIRLIISGDSNA